MISEKIKADLEKKQYAVRGNAAVQVCAWNKKYLQERAPCYKQIFYGIHTHKCMQFSPVPIWCSNECVFCWRPTELMKPDEFKDEDEIEKMVADLIKGRRDLLSGFGGREGMDLELWKDSLVPDHYAISLSGEPTLYPKLPELINYLRYEKKARSIFVVSNGTFPKMIERMDKEKALPDQLYISIVAPNEPLYKKIVNPKQKDAWVRFNKTLELVSKIEGRTVLRFTLIRYLNDKKELIPEFTKLFEKAKSDFIEVKAYMFLGYSQKRLEKSNMPLHKEVKEYTKELLKHLENYELVDEHAPSRILLLRRKDSKHKKEMF